MKQEERENPDRGSQTVSRSRYAGKAASRYARSFFQMMEKKNRVPETHEELIRVFEFYRRHREFSRLLLATTISYEEKEDLIDQLLTAEGGQPAVDYDISGDTRNFIKLLVKKKRFSLFEKIVESFHEFFNIDRGIEEITVVVPCPLTDPLEKKLSEVLAKKLEKKIVLSTKIDPDLIGGAVVYTRNQVIDGSVREKLRELRQALQEVSC